MQDALIQRYLGNKSSICGDIIKIVRQLASPGDLVFDAFSGSLAVAAALRAAGFRIACNDINHFSWLMARAFFSTVELPEPPLKGGGGQGAREELWQDAVDELVAPYPSTFPVSERRTDFWDHYCADGRKSAFFSKRGQGGRRRFFSSENAQAIDRAVSRIRHRHRSGEIDEITRALLTASLLNGIEKISNTQGTFHDFPRSSYDPRSLRPIRLRGPKKSFFCAPVSEIIGKAEDSLEFARRVPGHKVLYLDPPYNFRQYTSYYFMLNLVSVYPEVDDLDAYFSDIEFVRGQNMADDFKSSFCSKPDFIPSLRTLISRSRAEHVVLSYFDGRNHWGEFKTSRAEKTGRRLLEELFSSDLFVPGSLRCHPVQRLNYQSYGGHSAKPIQEFLFVAERSTPARRGDETGGVRWTGRDSVYEVTF